MIIRRKLKNGERGQVLILCAFCMTLLLLFVGLAIDFGLAYVTKARLGKAVDAAALTGAKSLYLGQPQATAVAQSSFAMNYGSLNGDAVPPVVNVIYTSDASGNTLMSVNATSTINTFFIGLVPAFRTLNVAASAQATRARVIMTLVLDTSGSLQTNGGWSALPPAVSSFIAHFDDRLDSVSMVHFASNVTVDLPMQTGGFTAPIQAATQNMPKSFFTGSTFSDGGLQQATFQNNSLSLPGNIVKVVVFFTDGHANTIQDTLNCGTAKVPSGLWNYGGNDAGPDVSYLNPTGASQVAHATDRNPPSSAYCAVSFPSHKTGTLLPITWSNVSGDAINPAEAAFRAIETANLMRSPANNMIVYSIGFSSGVDKPFLRQIANDPLSPAFDSSKPVGEADFAPTPADLQAIFDKLAYKILLRLTQ